MTVLFNLRKSLFNVIKSNYINTCQKYISSSPSLLCIHKHLTRSDSFTKKEKKFLEKDEVPINYQLIYKMPMESYVVWPMHFSTLTSVLIAGAAVEQFLTNNAIMTPTDIGLTMELDDIYYFTAGFIVITALLRLVVAALPLRIYKNQEKYLAVYNPQLPVGVSHHYFNRGQVQEVNYLLNPWNNISFKLGSKTSLVFENCFKTPSEFHEMQGF